VATLLQEPADPRGVGSGLDGYAHRRLLGGEASPEGLWGGPQPTLLYNLSALLIDEAQVGVLGRLCPIRLSPSVAVCYHPWWADPPFHWA
jgi:hypothetical protein